MFLTRRISLLRCVLYIIFQVCGAMIGSIVLKGVSTCIQTPILYTNLALESSITHMILLTRGEWIEYSYTAT